MHPEPDETIALPMPAETLAFTGERFTPGLAGEIAHEHYHRYLFARELVAGLDVVDVASGEGYGAALLAGRARSVVGVELDTAVVAHAVRSYARPGLAYRVGRCEALPLDDASADVVVSFETLEHVEAQSRFLAEVKRVLRPGGLLILSSPVRGVYSVGNPNPFHVRELTRDELEALVRTAFRNLLCLGQTPVVGSALLADGAAPPGGAPDRSFWRRADGGFETFAGVGPAPYLVVVASDGPLPDLHSGILHDHPYMARLLGDLKEAREAGAAAQEASAAARAEAAAAARERDQAARSAAELDAGLSRVREELRRVRALAERAAQPRGPRRLWESLRRRALMSRLRATGLFDDEHYRRTYPDVAGQDPVRHFVKYGAWGGRSPHPMFDTAFYLEQEPALLRRRVNPLLHFAREGAARGRRPHPDHTAEELLAQARPRATPTASRPPSRAPSPQPAPVRFRVQPLVGGPRARTDPPPRALTLVATHVLPTPPRAGNEYRIHRMLRWLRAAGHEVHLVVCPLPGEEPGPTALEHAAREHPHLYVCGRDGHLLHAGGHPDVRALLRALDGVEVRTLAPPRGGADPLEALERTFCPDAMLELLARLGQALDPDVFLVNYAFLSRALLQAPARALRVIDTHDVFSTKARKVVEFGVSDASALTAAQEAALLRRAELLVAIQPEEERELRALAPDRAVVTAGVDFEVAPWAPPPQAPVLLYVGSGNALNIRGIRDFLALAWPIIRRERPDARLRVIGAVCDHLDRGVDGVEVLGRVDRLADAYAEAHVVINPSVAGTGLKIKTVEALAAQRPVVTWPAGVDGLGPELRRLCRVVRDGYGFARAVLDALGDDAPFAASRAELEALLAPGRVYGALEAALAAHLRARPSPAAALPARAS